MVDWNLVETIRASIFDVLRTFIFGIGGYVAYVELRESYRLRRLQVLSSFNERLARCSKANKWIDKPTLEWDHLDVDTKYEYQNYIATFEDIGVARSSGILTQRDFIASYGGRFSRLYRSGTIKQFTRDAEYRMNDSLKIILADIGESL